MSNNNTSPWTEDHINELKVLFETTPMFCSDIAVALNRQFGTSYSKGSVIGKINRLKLSRPDKEKRVVIRHKRPKVIEVRAKTEVIRMTPFRRPKITPPISQAELRTAPVEPRNITLMELTKKDCRYPTQGDVAPYLFCGLPKLEGIKTSYCPGHHFLCWAPARERMRSAA